MRERLIELISKCELSMWGKTIRGGVQGEREYIADYLLTNGVIVLSCKVGDIVYYIDGVRIYKLTILNISLHKNEPYYKTKNIDFDNDAIGKSIFLTREEAEQALKNGEPICDYTKTNWNDCCECSVKDCCYKYNERSEVIDDLLGEVIGEIKKERR